MSATEKQEKKANAWTLEELAALPQRAGDEVTTATALIFFPTQTEELHDSGYRMITVVSVVDGIPKEVITTFSDHLWLQDLGTFGGHYRMSMDCLVASGAFRIFSSAHLIQIGCALSSLDISFVPEPKKEKAQ